MSDQQIEAPQSQRNPFARQADQSMNIGTVTIESERAIAEVQAKLVIAMRNERKPARAYDQVIKTCQRYEFAEEATYSYKRGSETIGGPSIRLAEAIARAWGTIEFGTRELSRKDGVSEMEAYCWDLQTNTQSSQKFTVKHVRDTKSGQYPVKGERDIYEVTANMAGRRLRARILAIVPPDLVSAALEECARTLANGDGNPLADRIAKAVAAFSKLGVNKFLLEARLKHPVDAITGEELSELIRIHNSIRDGQSAASEWFEGIEQDRSKVVADAIPATVVATPQERLRDAIKESGIQWAQMLTWLIKRKYITEGQTVRDMADDKAELVIGMIPVLKEEFGGSK
jgi:hypothetical protein